MTIWVPLRGKATGKFAFVDDQDAEWALSHKWYLGGSYTRYAFRTAQGRSFFMHREILNPGDGLDTDHINRDTLDNRRSNLRAVTRAVNLQNTERSDRTRELHQQIRDLRSQGLRRAEITRRLGLSSSSTVSDVLRGHCRDPHPGLIWSRDRLIACVQDFHAEHGRHPLQRELDGRDGRPWFPQVYRRFQSYRELVEAAGLEYVDGRTARRRRVAA